MIVDSGEKKTMPYLKHYSTILRETNEVLKMSYDLISPNLQNDINALYARVRFVF